MVRRLAKLNSALSESAEFKFLRGAIDCLAPLNTEAWSLSQGAHTLEPYAVGTTYIVDILEDHSAEPELWKQLSSSVDRLVAEGADKPAACAELSALFNGWLRGSSELRGTTGHTPRNTAPGAKEMTAALSAVTFMADRAVAGVDCLCGTVDGAETAQAAQAARTKLLCDLPDAWIAARGLAEAASRAQNKHSRMLAMHDLEVAEPIKAALSRLSEHILHVYDGLELSVRPPGTDERIRVRQEHTRQKKMERGRASNGGGDHRRPVNETEPATAENEQREEQVVEEEEVAAGALDKAWGALTQPELDAARRLGCVLT